MKARPKIQGDMCYGWIGKVVLQASGGEGQVREAVPRPAQSLGP